MDSNEGKVSVSVFHLFLFDLITEDAFILLIFFFWFGRLNDDSNQLTQIKIVHMVKTFVKLKKEMQ